MQKVEKRGIIEGLKEGLRIIILGLLSYLLAEGVVQFFVVRIFESRLDATQVTIVSGFVLSVLKSIDKWAYKTDRTFVPLEGATGITGV